MLYTGIEYSQAHDEEIIIHHTEYTAKMEPLYLPKKSKNRALDALEVGQFKSLVGQLQWTAKQTCPNIAFAACKLDTKVKDATTNDVCHAYEQVYGNYKVNLVLYVSQTLVMCVKVLCMFTQMPPLLILQDAVLKVAMLFSSKEKMVKLHR